MTEEQNNKKSKCSSLDELVDDMQNGNYKHIQIFVYKNEPINIFGMDDKFLVVNFGGHSFYKLTNMEYGNEAIKLEFLNPETGNPVTANLDIKHTKSDLFIIDREDLTNLINDDQAVGIDELLELDED